jgi:hypothetical protein
LIDELAGVVLRETAPGVYRLDHAAGKHDDRAVALALAAQALIAEGDPGPATSMVRMMAEYQLAPGGPERVFLDGSSSSWLPRVAGLK